MESECPYLSVVIPAWNEERRLPGSLRKIVDYLDEQGYPWEIIVVDDGSSDDTVGVTQAFMARHPEVRLIQIEHRGKGYAVRTGVLAAQGRFILFSDADLATPIEELGKLLGWFERGYDVVIGSREGVGARRYGEPSYRHLTGRLFNLVAQALAVRGVQDTQCGFKCFRHQVAEDLFRRMKLYNEGTGIVKGGMVTGFDVEVLFLARKRGYKVKEVPVKWYYSKESKVNLLKDSWRNLCDVVKVRLNDLRGFYD